jgi:hypothetical protein
MGAKPWFSDDVEGFNNYNAVIFISFFELVLFSDLVLLVSYISPVALPATYVIYTFVALALVIINQYYFVLKRHGKAYLHRFNGESGWVKWTVRLLTCVVIGLAFFGLFYLRRNKGP